MFDLNLLEDLEEKEAIALVKSTGMRCRVVERNGKSLIVNRDLRSDRVNLFINFDKVYKASIG
jgi:ribosomal protein L36